jgi:hypothetical protein
MSCRRAIEFPQEEPARSWRWTDVPRDQRGQWAAKYCQCSGRKPHPRHVQRSPLLVRAEVPELESFRTGCFSPWSDRCKSFTSVSLRDGLSQIPEALDAQTCRSRRLQGSPYAARSCEHALRTGRDCADLLRPLQAHSDFDLTLSAPTQHSSATTPLRSNESTSRQPFPEQE